MDAMANILGRRSVRSFENRSIGEGALKRMFEAAMSAPSACCRDPWRFVLIRERARLRELSAILPNAPFLAEAAAGVLVFGDLARAHDQLVGYLIQDCSAAIENLLLAAHALGYGGCWVGIYPREERAAKIREFVAVPPSWVAVSAVALGFPTQTPLARTRFENACVLNGDQKMTKIMEF